MTVMNAEEALTAVRTTCVEVFRLEHLPTGDGPYILNNLPNEDALVLRRDPLYEEILMGGACSSRPSPGDDGLRLEWTRIWKFGFVSMDALWDWFPRDMVKRIEAANYGVVTYHVPAGDVRYGRHQCMFDAATAQKKEV